MDPETLSDIITEHQTACVIHCWIQPRASKTSIAGLHDGSLKISLAAPPVDGQANAELCKFLAKILNLSKSSVTISAGDTSRRKSVRIEGITKTLLIDKLIIKAGFARNPKDGEVRSQESGVRLKPKT